MWKLGLMVRRFWIVYAYFWIQFRRLTHKAIFLFEVFNFAKAVIKDKMQFASIVIAFKNLIQQACLDEKYREKPVETEIAMTEVNYE